jgi:hypothetical protein
LAIGTLGIEMAQSDANPGTVTVATLGLALGGIGFTTAGFLLWRQQDRARAEAASVRVAVGPRSMAVGGAF